MSMKTVPAGLNRASIFAACLFMANLLASPAALAEGDVDAGKIKAETCLGCHGIADYSNIYPTYRVPKIAGQHETYIIAALQAYKSGDREHPTMSAQAKAMSEQDIADIAAYLASLNAAE